MYRLKRWGRIVVLAIIFILSGVMFSQYYDCWVQEDSPFDRFSLAFTFFFLCCPLGYFLLIAVCRYFFYREIPTVPPEELPVCTVIIPAYNEGETIKLALESVCRSEYPADKLEIIAVNDGSIDDTLRWMQQAAEESGGRIRVITYPENHGKRYALYQGFRSGSGEVFVTVDSDSLLKPDALARMVSPFRRDHSVGAVSGNVRVANLEGGIFPPMIDAGFTFAFDFIRAGQTVFKSVFCTPGALSAYRRTVLMPLLNEWLNQTFFGQPAGIGEDRALTNLILRQGYGVIMQRSAYIYTNVPECYRGISKMLLRWERSNIRENLEMYSFIFRNFRFTDPRRWFMLATLLLYTLMTVLPVVMIWFTLYNIFTTNGTLVLSIAATAMLWSTLPALVNLQRNSLRHILYCYFYGIFHALTLFWVVPYAVFTIGNSRWLTRSGANSAGKI